MIPFCLFSRKDKGLNRFSSITEEQAASVKEALVEAVSRTELGRHLLAFIEKEGITLEMSTDFSRVDASGGSASAGYWDAVNKKIVLDPRNKLNELLHFFAHETRHAAQTVALQGSDNAEILHPFNLAHSMRLMEMDADTFAVYFIADYTLKVKPDDPEQESPFATMLRPPREYMATRNGVTSLYETLDRAQLYRAAEESWAQDKNNFQKMMTASASAFLNNQKLLRTYNDHALSQWEEAILPILRKHAAEPESEFAQAFTAAARRLKDKTYTQPEEHIKKRAAIFSKLFNEAGVPDYLAGLSLDAVAKSVMEEPVTHDSASHEKYDRAVDTFKEAIDAYIAKADAAPRPRARKKSAALQRAA